MLILEALGALWFWAQFSSAVFLPSSPDSILPAVRASEAAWNTPAAAWSDPLSATYWKTHWQDVTGCCVDFVSNPQDGVCHGRIRLVQAKSLPQGDSWRMGFLAVSCG